MPKMAASLILALALRDSRSAQRDSLRAGTVLYGGFTNKFSVPQDTHTVGPRLHPAI